MNDSQREAIEFLSSQDSYSPKPESVERRETHGAIVFLAGERAYKLKRAVRFSYMDYSTVEARRTMCEREFAINRRTAPDLYLEVRSLVRDEKNRVRFGTSDKDSRVVDWVIVMRRFPETALLEQMCRRGEITSALMRRLGEEIVAFHAEAQPACAHGGSPGIRAVLDENAVLLRRYGFDSEKNDRLRALSYAALESFGTLLDRRRDEGKVRRCHGDLHLNNICMIEGKPVLFDAIEFNDSFSCVDVFYDLAFLLMDLMRHGLHNCADALLNRYLELTGDYDGLAALPLFLSCRAAVRAHVTMSRARQTPACRRMDGSDTLANELIDFALACFERNPPCLIAIGGISGTGKSTLAYRVAETLTPAPGAVVLRSDVTRKRMIGVVDDTRLPESAYTRDVHDRVYATLAKHATLVLASGYSVVVDAVFGQAEERSEIARVAAERDVQFQGLWLEAPTEVLKERVMKRRGDASDATMRTVDAQVAHVKVPTNWYPIDAGGTPGRVFARATCLLGG